MILYYEIRNGQRCCELLLSHIKYNPDGSLKSGWVENGCWDFEIRSGEVLAKHHDTIINRWPLVDYRTTEVPTNIEGDYNDIIHKMLEGL